MNMAAGDCHRKIEEIIMEPKEIPSCLILRLLVVFTQQLEILVTPVSLWEFTCTTKLTHHFHKFWWIKQAVHSYCIQNNLVKSFIIYIQMTISLSVIKNGLYISSIDDLHYIQVLRKPITYVALHSFSIILILKIVIEKISHMLSIATVD